MQLLLLKKLQVLHLHGVLLLGHRHCLLLGVRLDLGSLLEQGGELSLLWHAYLLWHQLGSLVLGGEELLLRDFLIRHVLVCYHLVGVGVCGLNCGFWRNAQFFTCGSVLGSDAHGRSCCRWGRWRWMCVVILLLRYWAWLHNTGLEGCLQRGLCTRRT